MLASPNTFQCLKDLCLSSELTEMVPSTLQTAVQLALTTHGAWVSEVPRDFQMPKPLI